jgi:hypothetical protein
MVNKITLRINYFYVYIRCSDKLLIKSLDYYKLIKNVYFLYVLDLFIIRFLKNFFFI